MTMTSELYRLEHSLVGDRLMPITRPEEATHAGVALLRRMLEDWRREAAALRSEGVRREQRIAELEAQLGRAIHRGDQADARAAHHEQEVTRASAALRKLAEKNGELIGEKKRLRDQLVAKHGLPAIHYRIDVDRDGQAYESLVFVLEAFPHPEHRRAALAEARQQEERSGGRLRNVRLDTVAWRAIVQQPIEE